MQNLSLRIKLLIFTLGISLGSLLLAGYLVDRNLLSYHEATAQGLIDEGFASLDARLKTLEEALANEAGFLSDEDRLLAALSLINRFQNRDDYQAILFDEEKQRLASRLQTSVQSSLSTGAYLYDIESQLVAFVQEQELGYLQGFVSYDQGKPQLRQLGTGSHSAQALDPPKQEQIMQLAQLHSELPSSQDYRSYQDRVYLEQKHPLEQLLGGEMQKVGYLVLVHQLEPGFLMQMTPGGLQIGLMNHHGELLVGQPQLAKHQFELETAVQASSHRHFDLMQTPAGFWGLRSLTPNQDHLDAAFLYPMASYQAARASTGQAISTALILAALVILPLSLVLVRSLVTRPLEHLSQGVERIRQGDLLTPIELDQGDELGRFADAMSMMAGQLHQREVILNASNQELQRLSEVMAHHFQEPTRRLMVFSQHLQISRDPALGEDSQKSLQFIHDQAKRLSQLVSDVQRYLELDKVRLPKEPVNLKELLEELLQSPDLHKKIEFIGANIQLQQDLPIVYFSRRRLKEMFTALLANAVAYRNPNQLLRVQINSRRVKDCNYIYISDNGKGIEPKYRVQVFDLFIRLVSSDQNPGTGMGLAMVRRLMKQAGGDIGIEDGLDGGTTFVLSFPDQELNLHDEALHDFTGRG